MMTRRRPMRVVRSAILCLALAGCATTPDVELEGRDFAVQQGAVPAAAAVTDTEEILILDAETGALRQRVAIGGT